MRQRHTIWTLATGCLLAACGGSSPTASTATSRTSDSTSASSYFSYDAATKTVQIELVAGYDATAGRNFDGYSKGSLNFSVPAGWSVRVVCRNSDNTEYHSCAAVAGESATEPVFPGALTPRPFNGIGYGGSAVFSFTPSAAGKYRFACLVGNHAVAGMWDVLTVTSSGVPSISTGASS